MILYENGEIHAFTHFIAINKIKGALLQLHVRIAGGRLPVLNLLNASKEDIQLASPAILLGFTNFMAFL